MKHDSNVIEICRTVIEESFGDLSDLPKELANTVANIYYNHYNYIANYKACKGKYFPDELKDGNNFISNFEQFIQNKIFLETSVESLPDIIDNLRDMEEVDANLYNYTVEVLLDIYKYKIKNVLKKSLIRRRIERRFCEVNEITNLIDLILLEK